MASRPTPAATESFVPATGRPEPAGDGPPVIEVDRLGVQYSLRLTRRRSLRRTLRMILRRRSATFWALRDFSLVVGPGEVLAVIGPNGAGKTTLLRTLAGIIKPSEGSVTVRGTVGAFLGSGGAFDPELSGRFNIALFAAFLGTDPRELRERTEAIIRFAGIGDYIDAPMRTYSSGMRARLGFSVASVMEPDVLLLDEVVSAGDYEYRTRSKARVQDLLQVSRAIVLVTHDLLWVSDFCTRAVVIEHGAIVDDGKPAEVVERYKERATKASTTEHEDGHGDERPWARPGRR
jgi:ABC-type polysaccharide/polyol phosphate transport system ATPase subunit